MVTPKVEGNQICKAKIGSPQRVCGRPKALHTGEKCLACFGPIEHHNEDEQRECWENRARMARATKEAGPIELHYKRPGGEPDKVLVVAVMSDIDLEALRKCPEPDTLTEFGYLTQRELKARRNAG